MAAGCTSLLRSCRSKAPPHHTLENRLPKHSNPAFSRITRWASFFFCAFRGRRMPAARQARWHPGAANHQFYQEERRIRRRRANRSAIRARRRRFWRPCLSFASAALLHHWYLFAHRCGTAHVRSLQFRLHLESRGHVWFSFMPLSFMLRATFERRVVCWRDLRGMLSACAACVAVSFLHRIVSKTAAQAIMAGWQKRRVNERIWRRRDSKRRQQTKAGGRRA